MGEREDIPLLDQLLLWKYDEKRIIKAVISILEFFVIVG